jgi:hypothetical protein
VLTFGHQEVDKTENQQGAGQKNLGIQGIVAQRRNENFPNKGNDDDPDEHQNVELAPLEGLYFSSIIIQIIRSVPRAPRIPFSTFPWKM